MIVRVNGTPHDLAVGTTITALLALIQAPPEGVAVAVNGEVVPRAEHRERRLQAEDRVEVIRAVGGG
jgi:sulfur carrier protein